MDCLSVLLIASVSVGLGGRARTYRVPPGPRVSIVTVGPPGDRGPLGRLDLLAGKQPAAAHGNLDAVGNDHCHRAEQVVDLEHGLGAREPRLAQVEVDRPEDRAPRQSAGQRPRPGADQMRPESPVLFGDGTRRCRYARIARQVASQARQLQVGAGGCGQGRRAR